MTNDDDKNEDHTLFEGAGLSAAARTSVVSRNPPAGNSNVSDTQDEKQVSVTILLLVLTVKCFFKNGLTFDIFLEKV